MYIGMNKSTAHSENTSEAYRGIDQSSVFVPRLNVSAGAKREKIGVRVLFIFHLNLLLSEGEDSELLYLTAPQPVP